MRIQLCAAALLMAAGSAAADEKNARDPFAARPSDAEMVKLIPPDVLAAGGRVVLACKVDAQGAVSPCQVVSESPAGKGVGAAFLSIAPKYRLNPEATAAAAARGFTVIVENWYRTDKQADWRRRPTAENLVAVWPTKAFEQGLEGQTTLECIVTPQGSLSDCVVMTESPLGAGFGGAALALTPQFTFWPAQRNGQAVASSIRIPITFRWPAGYGRGAGPGVPSRLLVPAAISWTEAPSISDLGAAYPPKARAAKLSGFAALSCNFTKAGRLSGCTVDREEPRSQGFGPAARSLTDRFQLDPAALGDKPINKAQVKLRVAFDARTMDAAAEPFGKLNMTTTPTPNEMASALKAAPPSKPAGRAMMDCRVAQGGRLEDCRIASEDPAGSGFGRVALALREQFKVATWSDEGLPVVGLQVRLPLRFEDALEPKPSEAPTKP